MLDKYKTYLVAHCISGVFPNARESHVGTVAMQILLDLPCEVDIVGTWHAQSEGPDVPLEDVLVPLVSFVCKKAADPALS